MAEISLLVRVNAAWLAMADRPFDFVAWALAITLMSSVFTARVWSLAFPSCQKFWSCCQNEGVLPMLATHMMRFFQMYFAVSIHGAARLIWSVNFSSIHVRLTILADLASPAAVAGPRMAHHGGTFERAKLAGHAANPGRAGAAPAGP